MRPAFLFLCAMGYRNRGLAEYKAVFFVTPIHRTGRPYLSVRLPTNRNDFFALYCHDFSSDIVKKCGTSKTGHAKLQFCGKQAKKDGLEYFWVDTWCINNANHVVGCRPS
jgi:hypothetical protein